MRKEKTGYASERTGSPTSPRTLEALPSVPYVLVNRRAIYDEKDLEGYIKRVLADPRRSAKGRRISLGSVARQA